MSATSSTASSVLMTPGPKKRGRPKKEKEEVPEGGFDDASWNDNMIESLLKSRLETNKDTYLNCKDKNGVAAAWINVVKDVNAENGVILSVTQVKAKFKALKKQYTTLAAAQQATGNAKKPRLPACWPLMVNFFSSREGLNGQSFGSSTAAQNFVSAKTAKMAATATGTNDPFLQNEDGDGDVPDHNLHSAVGDDEMLADNPDLKRLRVGEADPPGTTSDPPGTASNSPFLSLSPSPTVVSTAVSSTTSTGGRGRRTPAGKSEKLDLPSALSDIGAGFEKGMTQLGEAIKVAADAGGGSLSVSNAIEQLAVRQETALKRMADKQDDSLNRLGQMFLQAVREMKQ
ncbi:hypothetical protein DFJ73DRAFT_819320 [Zopfochytrium polystomum]|nr:hypothetical protein DFJ73DRAFT_878391 [Zopfochytrium polystomum]KAI9327831.1 hypothetical protein DFJ73DRAFT_862725 [Zopfochytrium polystomum]KAI9358254.1 hypothetical protein DFJ73DRAFT_819320 [Zopfochytrium polystomum]